MNNTVTYFFKNRFNIIPLPPTWMPSTSSFPNSLATKTQHSTATSLQSTYSAHHSLLIFWNEIALIVTISFFITNNMTFYKLFLCVYGLSRCDEVLSPIQKSITPKIATPWFEERLEKPQHSMQICPESRSYSLRTKIVSAWNRPSWTAVHDTYLSICLNSKWLYSCKTRRTMINKRHVWFSTLFGYMMAVSHTCTFAPSSTQSTKQINAWQ
jgi:hypothetical protein